MTSTSFKDIPRNGNIELRLRKRIVNLESRIETFETIFILH